MTKTQIIVLLEKHNLLFSDFKKYMIHKTFSTNKQGEFIYNEIDVNNFIKRSN